MPVDVVLLCRDAHAESIVDAMLFARDAVKAGRTAGVIVTGAALLAMSQGHFLWSRGFWPQQIRWGIADRAKAVGMPVTGRGQFRALDVKGVILQARDAGVRLFACPTWIPLLGLEDALPEYLQSLDHAGALEMMERASTVVGSF
ncbi:MAG TPA: hypothetical protein VET65_04805 [Candidatus Limnocylindrales bacterium]|nr:hypothetical protein [Candidatus Limnocylindrales bacterium]